MQKNRKRTRCHRGQPGDAASGAVGSTLGAGASGVSVGRSASGAEVTVSMILIRKMGSDSIFIVLSQPSDQEGQSPLNSASISDRTMKIESDPNSDRSLVVH